MSAKMKRAARLAPKAARETPTSSPNSTPGNASLQRVPTRISVLKSLTGALSKAYGWRNDKLEKQPAPQLYEGSCWSVEINCLAELAALLDQLQDNQALALCNVARDATAVVVDEKANPLNGTIARTKDHFWWDATARAYMLFDVDVSDYMVEQVLQIIRNLDHAFADAAAVGRYSTSSYINGPNGFTTGAKGLHLYVLVMHPELMGDVGKILAKRLWLTGFGHIALARNGRMLVRQPIDASVWSPERLIYEASPVLRDGLAQNRPPTEVFPGQIVDLSLVTPLTDDEEAEYGRLVADAKAAMLPKALRKFDHYLANAAFEQATTPEELGKKWMSLKPNIDTRSDTLLPPEFPLDLGKFGEMTVAELVAKLDAGERFEGNFPDPVEGSAYNRTCAYVQPERTRTGYWRIFSHAHGGIFYRLSRGSGSASEDADDDREAASAASGVDVSELVAKVREVIAMLPSDPGALFASTDARSALQTIRAADRAEWVRLRKEILDTRAFKAAELDEWLRQADHAASDEDAAGEADEARPDLVAQLVELVKDNATLACEDEYTGVAITRVGGSQRVYRVPSAAFDTWVRGLYYDNCGRGISDATMSAARQTLLAACVASGNRVETHIRTAVGPDGAYYMDLCNDLGRAVRVTPGAWEVVSNPPVLFLRPRDALPLPEPHRLDDWRAVIGTDFLPHLNLAPTQVIERSNGTQATVPSKEPLLVLAYILEVYRPDTPYPVLEIDGIQGSAKSSMQRRLRDVTDPHKVPLRGRPKTVEDIYIAANNNHVVSYENVSSLTAEQQDALCVLSTGGGHAGRALYTNGEEYSVQAKRPIVINGIGAAVTRPDLIDRTIHIELPIIDDTDRKSERELDAAWAQSYPRAFSALIHCFAETLAQLPNVKLAKRPRLADFAELGSALALALRGQPSVFLRVLEVNRAAGYERAMDAYPVAAAVVEFLDRNPAGFIGTVGDLFSALRYEFGTSEYKPRTPRGMSAQLKRVAPALKGRGIDVTWMGHGSAGNRIAIGLVTPAPATATSSAPVSARKP